MDKKRIFTSNDNIIEIKKILWLIAVALVAFVFYMVLDIKLYIDLLERVEYIESVVEIEHSDNI